MMPEERLVSQIRDFVRAENPEPTPEIEDLAEQYAELCEVVNERLIKCGDFLDKGMRSEAVHEMQVPPPLLEQVDVLNFREVTKWRNLCEDLGLRVFTPLRVDIVDRLRAEATTEEALAPLLNEYRRLVHHGSRDERINILRRIREHDADNPVWYENLAPLEEAQLEELVPRIRQALEAEDIPALAKLRDELEHPQRACPAPEELVRQVNSVLRSSELREARAKADELTSDIEEAYGNRDEERLERLLAKWDEVTADDEVRVDDTQRQRVENIREWLQSEQKKRRADRQFQEALSALESQVTRDLPDRDEVRRLWREVMNSDRPVPADVRERVMAAISRVDEHERSRRRRRVLVGGAAFLLLLVLIVGVGVVLHSVQTRNRAIRQVATLVENEDYRAALNALERVKSNSPSIYATSEMQQLRSRAETALQQREQRRAAFQASMDKLRAIGKAGFDASESRVRSLVEEAEELAVEESQKARLKSWRDSRELAQMRDREQREVRFSQALRSLRNQLEANQEKNFSSFEAEQEAIEDMRQQLDQVRAEADQVAESSLEKLDPIEEQIAAWQQDLDARIQERETRLEKKQRMLRAIDNAPPDLDLLVTLMRGFVEDHPEDPNIPRMRRVLEDVQLFRDMLALENFSIKDFPLEDEDKTAVKQQLDALPQGERSIWHEDLERALAVTERFPEAVKALNAIGKLPGLDLKVFEIRRRNSQVWQKVYYPETILDRDGELYWGRVCRTSSDEAKPWVEHRKFSSEDYEVRIARRDESNLVPHAKYVRELAEQVRNREQRIDAFLAEVMQTVLEHEELPPIPKAWLLDICSAALRKCAVHPVKDLERIRELLGDVPRKDNWFHLDHPDVAELNERLEMALERFPDIPPILDSIRRHHKLLSATLSRQPGFVGRVVADDDNGQMQLDVPGDTPEAWIIRIHPDRREREIRIVSDPQAPDDGALRVDPAAKSAVYDGQLLFAPSDGRRTDAIRRSLDASEEEISIYSAWPRR